MDWTAIEMMYERALQYTFSKTKFAITTTVLSLCGLLFVFSMGLSLSASLWVSLSLSFLPIFISSGVLIALGVILIRAYHDEIKQKKLNYVTIIKRSWESALSSSYFFMPVILVYLLLWVLLGVFFLLKEVPFIGQLFSVIFAFGPFLLLLTSFALLAISLFALFSLTPLIALKNYSKEQLLEETISLFRIKLLTRLALMVLAVIPVAIISLLLWISAKLTTVVYFVNESHVQLIMQWFVIMLPFAAILSFPVIFSSIWQLKLIFLSKNCFLVLMPQLSSCYFFSKYFSH